jgi:hypothetical protein
VEQGRSSGAQAAPTKIDPPLLLFHPTRFLFRRQRLLTTVASRVLGTPLLWTDMPPRLTGTLEASAAWHRDICDPEMASVPGIVGMVLPCGQGDWADQATVRLPTPQTIWSSDDGGGGADTN